MRLVSKVLKAGAAVIAVSLPIAVAAGQPALVARAWDAQSHDRAVTAYARANVALHKGDDQTARRAFAEAIEAEESFFAGLSERRRQGEASFYVEYLTLAGFADYRRGDSAAAYARWRRALALYQRYLPVLATRDGQADRLVAQGRYREAFSAYPPASLTQDPDVVQALHAGSNGHWADAERSAANARGTTGGDLLRGILLLRQRRPATAVAALVAVLADYERTSSETPSVGPVQASAIRLLLHAAATGS